MVSLRTVSLGMVFMRGMLLLYLLALGQNLSISQESKSLPKFVPAANRAPDLDFSIDLSEDDVGYPGIAGQSESYRWVYISLGLGAAAGGMTYYLWDKEKAPSANKSVQVFSDAPN